MILSPLNLRFSFRNLGQKIKLWFSSSSPILSRMLLQMFFTSLLTSLVFFIILILLVDFFASIWRYFSNDIPLSQILQISVLYIPKAITFSIPVSLLFSVTFTLGNLYATNQLMAVFNAGISLFRFTAPLILVSFLLSVSYFFFEDKIVIPTYTQRQILVRGAEGGENYNSERVTIIGDDENIYRADFYNDSIKQLNKVLIVIMTKTKEFHSMYVASSAIWQEDHWNLNQARIFKRNIDDGSIEETYAEVLDGSDLFLSPPELFQHVEKNLNELDLQAAKSWIDTLRRTGRPYLEALTEYYARFSFALTSFIVSFIACSVGGRFKKNILLMSLLIVIVIAGGYYILQIVLKSMAIKGNISPAIGAWLPAIIFIAIGFITMKRAKT